MYDRKWQFVELVTGLEMFLYHRGYHLEIIAVAKYIVLILFN